VTQLHFDGIGMTSRRTRDRLIQRLEERGIRNKRVLDTLANTPRHWFLDEALAHRAYEDTALPIGHGQTLSQPYIVAKMTELLLANMSTGETNVLEVGTGSGYQTAILAQLVDKVYSVERIKPLQDKAQQRLRKLGAANVQLKHADGGFGWQEKGPFNGILSTAAPSQVPQDLLAQLAPGGVLVIPVGDQKQDLLLVKHHQESGKFVRQVIEQVLFVPLLSGVSIE